MTTETKEQRHTLPEKPSALIRVALADMAKCEASENYEINMGSWHDADSDRAFWSYEAAEKTEYEPCEVCFAGSIMAQTLEVPSTENVTPGSFPDHLGAKLHSLENFRTGDVENAFSQLGLNSDKGVKFDRSIERYSSSKTQFRTDMIQLANDLEKEGY